MEDTSLIKMYTKTHKPPVLTLPSPKTIRNGIRRFARLVVARSKRYATRRNVLLAGGASLSLLVISYVIFFFWPRTVVFSFGQENCLTQPVLLPNLVTKKASPTYDARPVASLSVAGYPLYSYTTCVSLTAAPKENASEVIAFGSILFKKNIRVSSGAFPTLMNEATLEKPVPVREPLTLELDSPDRVFEYQLSAGDKKHACSRQDKSLVCDVAQMNLAQSTTYDFTLERQFKGKPAGTLFARSLTTVESVHVVASSIAADQTVYEAPGEMTLTLNRPATSIEGAHLYLVNGGTNQEVAATVNLNGNTIIVRFEQPLARSASFVFTVDTIKAADGGFLPLPLSFPFKTSGGPKVLGVNIGSSRVSQSGSIVITFDSPVSKTQAVQEFVRLEASGSAVAAAVSVQDNKVIIKPNSALPRCAGLAVKVFDGLQSNFGVAGGSAWQYNSRTICQSVFSIGTSVQGRSITAYSFGSGPSKIIFVGTTHGDEKSSTFLLQRWVDYLESSGNIPAHRTIIIIPNLNPDGFAMGRRTNANNVDLNRNFPANDWKSGVTMPDKSFNPNGGGSVPLSEPESAALAGFVTSQGPSLVLTYHAVAGVVIPNGSGNSASLAQTYDQKSNVGFANTSETDSIFTYDTTGAFEEWLHDKRSTPTLLVELWSKSGNEYSSHQAAMLAMIQSP